MNNYDDYNNNIVGSGNIEQKAPMSSIKILSNCGLALCLMTIAVFATQFIVLVIADLISPELAETGLFNVILTLIGIVGVGLPVFAIFMKRVPDSKLGEKKKLSLIEFLGFFIVCVASAYIANIVGLFLSAFIELINGTNIVNPVDSFIFNKYMVVAMIYAILVAPIVEEIMFRKILLDKLRRFGDFPAILITGFAFGIFHFNILQFFYATVLGIFFAYITIRTNRLIYAIVLHMLMNFIGAGLVPLVTTSQNMLGMGLVAIWFFGSLTVGSIIFILNIKKIRLIKPIQPLVRKRDYILNPGALLFIIIGTGIIVLNLL